MTKKKQARKLYQSLPFGQKIKFCDMLAKHFDVSPDYVLQRWFHSASGVPKKYLDETIKLLTQNIEEQ